MSHEKTRETACDGILGARQRLLPWSIEALGQQLELRFGRRLPTPSVVGSQAFLEHEWTMCPDDFVGHVHEFMLDREHRRKSAIASRAPGHKQTVSPSTRLFGLVARP